MNKMNELKDIELFTQLQKLMSLFQRVNQLSWISDQTRKRYPAPEMMTPEEMEALTKTYISLGFDIESIYNEWLIEYKKYKNEG